MIKKVPIIPIKSIGKKIIYSVPFKISDIKSVYVGIPHRCMCGCSGTYWYSSLKSAKAKGYLTERDETGKSISLEKVKRVYNKMKKNAHLGIEDLEGDVFTIIIGNTQYTIYLKD